MERTARDWLAWGPLDPVPGAKPARVSTSSLAKVLPAVERLRELGQDRELLRALVDRREDERGPVVASREEITRATPAQGIPAVFERGSLSTSDVPFYNDDLTQRSQTALGNIGRR